MSLWFTLKEVYECHRKSWTIAIIKKCSVNDLKPGFNLNRNYTHLHVVLDQIKVLHLPHGENYTYSTINWDAGWQNQQNDPCPKRRLRSAWASAQSDQSLHCPPEETLGPYLPTERTAKALIRLSRCPGWSESSLDAHVILLVLSCGSSIGIWATSWENLFSEV